MATKLGNIAVGRLVKLKENGVLVDFYVAKHDYENSLNGMGRTLVVRKDCYDERQWHSSKVNAYASSAIDRWLNGTYKNLLDADIRGVIGTTKIKYTPGNGNNTVGTLERAIFLLSATELNGSASWFNVEGTALPIASSLQIAYMNGSAVEQWTRSPYTISTGHAISLYTSGNVDHGSSCTYSYGSRPAFTLPASLNVSDDGTVLFNSDPVISGTDAALGTFGQTPPVGYSYTVTDADGDAVTVTEALDGTVLRTYHPVFGGTNVLSLSTDQWLTVLNGSHTITITADDGKGGTAVRTLTFTKKVDSICFHLDPPLESTDMASRAIESIVAQIPVGAESKIEVCNNAYDAEPAWQDVTQIVARGDNIVLKNTTKTADKWGYSVRVTIKRNGASGDCYVSGGSGYFD